MGGLRWAICSRRYRPIGFHPLTGSNAARTRPDAMIAIACKTQ
jgi:hypothetical protein